MLRIVLAIFLILHGLVHLLYLGHSRRVFELQTGMSWPDGAWAFTRLLGNEATRSLAAVFLLLAALAFLVSGAGLVMQQSWWRPAAAGAALFSTLIYVLLWNGTLQHLDNQGAFALLINLAIVLALFVFRWPAFGF